MNKSTPGQDVESRSDDDFADGIAQGVTSALRGTPVQEQHIGYIRKATMEAPTEIEMCKVCATAARNLRAWKAHRVANRNKASSYDVQGSAPGQERYRTRVFQTQRRLESMKALGGLAVWWHEQQLTKQTFWTAVLLDEIEGDILETRDIAFVMGYLNEEEARAVEQERLQPGPPPPPPQSTPLPQFLPPAKEAKQIPLEQNEAKEEERVCFWEELGDVDDERWWNNMVVAELGVVEKQQQGSQPAAWPDE